MLDIALLDNLNPRELTLNSPFDLVMPFLLFTTFFYMEGVRQIVLSQDAPPTGDKPTSNQRASSNKGQDRTTRVLPFGVASPQPITFQQST